MKVYVAIIRIVVKVRKKKMRGKGERWKLRFLRLSGHLAPYYFLQASINRHPNILGNPRALYASYFT